MGVQSLVGLANLRAVYQRQDDRSATAETYLKEAKIKISIIEKNNEKNVAVFPEIYADLIASVFDAAERNGISAREIREAYRNKVLYLKKTPGD